MLIDTDSTKVSDSIYCISCADIELNSIVRRCILFFTMLGSGYITMLTFMDMNRTGRWLIPQVGWELLGSVLLTSLDIAREGDLIPQVGCELLGSVLLTFLDIAREGDLIPHVGCELLGSVLLTSLDIAREGDLIPHVGCELLGSVNEGR